MTYTFNKDYLVEVLSHIVSYGLEVVSLSTQETTCIIQLTGPIPTEEYLHLQEGYDFMEVV